MDDLNSLLSNPQALILNINDTLSLDVRHVPISADFHSGARVG